MSDRDHIVRTTSFTAEPIHHHLFAVRRSNVWINARSCGNRWVYVKERIRARPTLYIKCSEITSITIWLYINKIQLNCIGTGFCCSLHSHYPAEKLYCEVISLIHIVVLSLYFYPILMVNLVYK